MLSDVSKGLFKNAILMSGSAFCKPWSLIPRLDWSLRLAKHLGYGGVAKEKDVLEFLEKPDGAAIVQAAKKVLTFEEEIGLHILYAFGPVKEPFVSKNCFIPKDPILMAREAWSKDVNLMVGATSNEGILRANCEAKKISDVLQNVNFFAPALELGVDVKSDKACDYGKQLKKVYYGSSSPSETNQLPYLYVRHTLKLKLIQLKVSHFSSFPIFTFGMPYNESFSRASLMVEPEKISFIASTLTQVKTLSRRCTLVRRNMKNIRERVIAMSCRIFSRPPQLQT